MQLAGSRVLLTGATGGIGRAIAVALHRRGGHLLLSGRRAEVLDQIRAGLGGERAECLAADLAGTAGIAELVERAGRVDVLVANAALPGSGRVDDFSPEEIDRVLDVNLRAPIQLTRALLPGMLERGHGHLVFVSSLAGKVASMRSGIYSATKFGLRGFAAGLREDLHGSGVGVTVVFPGFVAGAGMFAETEIELPRGVGTRRPDQVADAVVAGIERGRAEIDVAPMALRIGTAMASLAPVTMARVQRRLGSSELADALAHAQRPKR